MSEELNNQAYRQKELQKILMEIHDGVPIETVKEHFKAIFSKVDATELARAERALVEGGLPVSDIQKLCNIHAKVVGQSIAEIHGNTMQEDNKNHSITLFKKENIALGDLIRQIQSDFQKLPFTKQTFLENINKLKDINIHYLRKENIIFPFMEKHGIDVPPKVMWGVHDEIRHALKEVYQYLEHHNFKSLKEKLPELLTEVLNMIDKEEDILFPMIENLFSSLEWYQIARDSDEIGYCFITVDKDTPFSISEDEIVEEELPTSTDCVTFPTGALHQEEIHAILNALPNDITFVDKDDIVRYFSHGETRAFPRTVSVLGRNVENCHPSASVHIVKQILEDFKSGIKSSEDFWIKKGNQLILIRYVALHNEQNEYLGVLEMTQDIAPLKSITGEKRLLSH